jgi:prepilin-type N-terminal cleavage/methylation domain-containing protein
MKKSTGFTLVEFIIVLGMIGILGIIAVPIYKSRAVKNEALKIDAYEVNPNSRNFFGRGVIRRCSR